MGVNDIDLLYSNDPAMQSKELKIARKFPARRANRHDRVLEIGAGRLPRNDSRGHSEDRRAAWHVADDKGVRAYHHVVADCDRSDNFTTGAKIAVAANRRTADAAHVHNADPLIESAAMADFFRHDENATEVLDQQARNGFGLPRDGN